MESKIIGLILLACAAALFHYSYEDFEESFLSPATKVQKTLESDINSALLKIDPPTNDPIAQSSPPSKVNKPDSSKSNAPGPQKTKSGSSVQVKKTNEPMTIYKVIFRYRSEDAHAILKDHPPKFKTDPKGKVWLEVEVVDLPDEENPGFITQTSVFDMRSKNKIGEFGETYYYKNLDPKLLNGITKLKAAAPSTNSPNTLSNTKTVEAKKSSGENRSSDMQEKTPPKEPKN